MTDSFTRAALKGVWRGVAGVTRWMRVLPDFLIIGVQKGGTTSLFNYLIQHPQVARPTMKEVHFFDLAYPRGVDWYRSHFPLRATQSVAGAVWGSRITGESSPCYLAHPMVPERVATVVPNTRLIVLLRDPVTRAFSHYRMRVRRGVETRDFVEAIRHEVRTLRRVRHRLGHTPSPANRIAWNTLRNQSMLYRGRYAEQVRRWDRYFPRERMLFLRSEDFFRDERSGYAKALEFLGLREWYPSHFKRYNDAGDRPLIPTEFRQRLEAYYARHNRDLPSLLGDEFRWSSAGAEPFAADNPTHPTAL